MSILNNAYIILLSFMMFIRSSTSCLIVFFTCLFHSDVSAMKSALRSQIKKRIALMSPEQKSQKSLQIAEKLFENSEYQNARRVGIYISLNDEVQTEKVIENIFNTSKICFIPRYTRVKMDLVQMNFADEYNSFPKTKWGIPQPAEDDERKEALEEGGLDLLIMPGRAFTYSGDRLGRGGGYYDVYLKNYRLRYSSTPYTIGLAFSDQMYDAMAVEPHDERINTVIYA